MSTPPAGTGEATPGLARPGTWVTYLSGLLRGRSFQIGDGALRFVEDDGRLVAMEPTGEPPGTAMLQRVASGYQLLAPRGAAWVNGEQVTARVLASGDVIELEGGPVLLYQIGARRGGLEDALARLAERRAPRRLPPAGVLLRALMRLKQRAALLWRRARPRLWIVLVLLVGTTALLTLQTRDIERRLAREQQRVSGLADLLHDLEGQTLQRGELLALREELSKGLIETGERVRVLETGSAAVNQVIARASGSVVFVQGKFGFEDPATRRSLRIAVDKKGQALRTPDGRQVVTLEGSGPPVRMRVSGTAFVAGAQGLLLTNRHVALPWEDEAMLPALREIGLEPVMLAMRGYSPGAPEPFDVTFLAASDTHDVAVLQGRGAAIGSTALVLSDAAPAPGDTAIVLGYPTGLRALLARAGDAFVKRLSQRPQMSDEDAARELARAGMVWPLASRGIVGQVSGEAIAYDAQTTSGGSGAPVLNLKGEVIAVNRATLPEFGGSNLGVPVRHAAELLQRLQIESAPRPTAAGR